MSLKVIPLVHFRSRILVGRTGIEVASPSPLSGGSRQAPPAERTPDNVDARTGVRHDDENGSPSF
jgi:hypothetical protein